MNKSISVAIPHYNNSHFMNDTLRYIKEDDRIDEIIICDDKSNDIDKLENILNKLNCEKIKLFKNEVNIGCYHNKLSTLSKCKNEWACLIDSDNIIDKLYIDKIFEFENWKENVIYAPMWAYTFPGNVSQTLNYSIFKNVMFDSKKYIDSYYYKNNIIFKCLANTCNYFVNVKNYISIMNKYNYDREIIDSLDSCILLSDWLSNGNFLLVVQNLVYKHRVHSNSNYKLSKSKIYTSKVEKSIFDKLNNSLK